MQNTNIRTKCLFIDYQYSHTHWCDVLTIKNLVLESMMEKNCCTDKLGTTVSHCVGILSVVFVIASQTHTLTLVQS